MQLALYQIIVPLVSFVFICKAMSHFLVGRKTVQELISWVLVWGAIGVLSVFPESIRAISDSLGIKSSINAIIVLALGALFYMVFRLVVMVEDHEYALTKLIRYNAIKEVLGEHKPRKSHRRKT